MRVARLVVAVGLLTEAIFAGSAATDAGPTSSPQFSLVGTASMYEEGATVGVIAAFLPGRGWSESEDATGLVREGDHLSLYALEQGVLGEVVVAGEGELDSTKPTAAEVLWGLYYPARIEVNPESQVKYEAALQLRRADSRWGTVDLLVASTGPGATTNWLPATPLPGACENDSLHYRAVAEWLRSRGAAEAAIDHLKINQAVRADIDGNGQDEVLLSVRACEPCVEGDTSKPTQLGYLLMRRIRPGTSTVDTLVLDDRWWRCFWVCGLRDLDGDGWAEVITRGEGIDYTGAQLFRWDGQHFILVNGWGGGV